MKSELESSHFSGRLRFAAAIISKIKISPGTSNSLFRSKPHLHALLDVTRHSAHHRRPDLTHRPHIHGSDCGVPRNPRRVHLRFVAFVRPLQFHFGAAVDSVFLNRRAAVYRAGGALRIVPRGPFHCFGIVITYLVGVLQVCVPAVSDRFRVSLEVIQVVFKALFERAFLPPQPNGRPGDLGGHCDCWTDRSGRAPGSWRAYARWQRDARTTCARWQRNARTTCAWWQRDARTTCATWQRYALTTAPSTKHITDVAAGADDAGECAALHHSPLLLGARSHVFLFALGPSHLISPLEFRVFQGAILFFCERRLDARHRVGLSRIEFSEPFGLSGIDAC